MSRKKNQAIHQPFEGANPRGAFTKITADMMESEAWKALTLRQQGLYLHLKAMYRERKINGVLESSNADNIRCPESEWKRYYGTQRTFAQDRDALVEKGFIRIVQRGKSTRTANVYGFSEGWVRWRPPKR